MTCESLGRRNSNGGRPGWAARCARSGRIP